MINFLCYFRFGKQSELITLFALYYALTPFFHALPESMTLQIARHHLPSGPYGLIPVGLHPHLGPHTHLSQHPFGYVPFQPSAIIRCTFPRRRVVFRSIPVVTSLVGWTGRHCIIVFDRIGPIFIFVGIAPPSVAAARCWSIEEERQRLPIQSPASWIKYSGSVELVCGGKCRCELRHSEHQQKNCS
jgi:hypothetical protein